MTLINLPDDLILEVTSHLEVFGGYSLSLDFQELSVTQLHDVAVHMVKLEKNLSKERPVLRHPPIQTVIDGISWESDSLNNIPGTPLMLLELYRDGRIACYDYERHEMLCAVRAFSSPSQIAPLYHERGRCSRAIQLGDIDRCLSMLHVNYCRDSVTKKWEANMRLVPIPTPIAGSHSKLPTPPYNSAVVTDSKVVAYTARNYGPDGNGTLYLEVVALNVATGVSTRISTGIALNTPSETFVRYQPAALKDRNLFLLSEKSGCTHIWRIPDSLLPYDGHVVEPRIAFPLGSENDIGRQHRGSMRCPHTDIKPPLGHSEGDSHFEPDRDATTADLLADHLFCNTDVTVASVSWQARDMVDMSVSSLLYISCLYDFAKQLILTRYHDSPVRVTHHILELPKDFELGRVRKVSFDEGLGVVFLVVVKGQLLVLKYA
ncbi:hypothetical protein V5O48_015242 [Marasmius crinis-equi]|uniref:F-box domain-containing protein n=1 Tax=Marasmius crinis-equi TaxID=585013 RepID=A0ABR3EVD4_9AGAR